MSAVVSAGVGVVGIGASVAVGVDIGVGWGEVVTSGVGVAGPEGVEGVIGTCAPGIKGNNMLNSNVSAAAQVAAMTEFFPEKERLPPRPFLRSSGGMNSCRDIVCSEADPPYVSGAAAAFSLAGEYPLCCWPNSGFMLISSVLRNAAEVRHRSELYFTICEKFRPQVLVTVSITTVSFSVGIIAALSARKATVIGIDIFKYMPLRRDYILKYMPLPLVIIFLKKCPCNST